MFTAYAEELLAVACRVVTYFYRGAIHLPPALTSTEGLPGQLDGSHDFNGSDQEGAGYFQVIGQHAVRNRQHVLVGGTQ